MKTYLKKLQSYFTEPLLPAFLLHLSTERLCGLRIKGRDDKAVKYFIQPLKPGLIEPSAEKNNVRQPEELLPIINQGMRQLGGQGGAVSLLLPEPCFRLFVFPAATLPPSPQEQQALLRWRIKKLYPLLPDDWRFDYQAFRLNSSLRILVSGTRRMVVEEYEKLLAMANWRVRVVSPPTLHLLTLVPEADFLVVNVENDYLALTAVADSCPLFYRLKAFRMENLTEENFGSLCLAEIENTLHFLEDKEKRQFKEIFIRWGVSSFSAGSLIKALEQLQLRVSRYHSMPFPDIEEREILAPLLGQIKSYQG